MKVILVIPILFFLFLAGCTPDENSNVVPAAIVARASIPMTAGNYWIYQHYSVDSNGVETIRNRYDSLVVSPTSEFQLFINETRFTMKNTLDYPPEYNLTDSGSFYKLNTPLLYVVPKTSFPVNLPEYYVWNPGNNDTIFVERISVSLVQNPLLVSGTKAVKIDRRIPARYQIPKPLHFEDIIIPDVGFYQFEISFSSEPYPKLRRKLIRYHVKPLNP